MGIWDRDWYVQKLRERENYRERADTRRSQGNDARDATYHGKPSREVRRHTKTPELSDLPGSGWHWTVKVIFLGCALVLILMAMRYIKV